MSTTPAQADSPCPCGSGRSYRQCCAPFHLGDDIPATAEALMRSRYCAYALGLADYLRDTWASRTRPSTLALEDSDMRWVSLTICATRDGGPTDQTGEVEFIARSIAGDRLNVLHETSRFLRENGRWRYLDGDLVAEAPVRVGRNAPCPCGSGRKFKRCHGA